MPTYMRLTATVTQFTPHITATCYTAEYGHICGATGAITPNESGNLDSTTQLNYYIGTTGLNLMRHAIDHIAFDATSNFLDGCQFSNETLTQILTAMHYETARHARLKAMHT